MIFYSLDVMLYFMNQSLVKSFDESDNNAENSFSLINKKIIVSLLIGGLLIGLFVGYIYTPKPQTDQQFTNTNEKTITEAGVMDEKKFPDKAEGVLKEGGIDGEGSFHLQRPGGESQNVYLTSSTVDLTQFINKKVEVWGATYKGEKAGWLMDVGYIKIIE
ncbi:MAG: hypothetical protein KatS3mg090_0184 [Patescibacteria group bacterium]|nr:MAG: hypothetical protein KatS3mg090_0184 [Patescibacteria group bacterium]